MIKLKYKYRFTAVVLLTVIFSHIAIFHFSLSTKVICKDEGEIFHIENIENSHIEATDLLNIARFENVNRVFCVDYRLDIHTDKNLVKPNYNFSAKYIKSLNPDFEKTTESKTLITYVNKNFYTYNAALESLSKIALII